jgi:hypothetical protein
MKDALHRVIIDWLRRAPGWRQARVVLGPDVRRRMLRLLDKREFKRTAGRAMAGRVANLDDLEAFITANPVRLRTPLVLVSQVQRSGGTLLSQLFDNHPQLAAHPDELKIGYLAGGGWPLLDPALGPARNFELLFEVKIVGMMKRGFNKGYRDLARHRFFIIPRLQYSLFKHLFTTEPPQNAREILDLFFTSYFNAWLNYRGDLREKRWITAFAPRFADKAANVAGLFGSYPDGRLIHVLRDPKNWFPSASLAAAVSSSSLP